MNSKHQFNFYEVTRTLDFYQKVKLVNYVRRQLHGLCCVMCDTKCSDLSDLVEHMNKNKHYAMPDVKVFNQPE